MTAPKPTTVSTNGATATTGAVPADFPKDVPVYKDATVISAASQGGTNYGAVGGEFSAPVTFHQGPPVPPAPPAAS